MRRESDREGFWEERERSREGEGRGRRQGRTDEGEGHIYRFPVGRGRSSARVRFSTNLSFQSWIGAGAESQKPHPVISEGATQQGGAFPMACELISVSDRLEYRTAVCRSKATSRLSRLPGAVTRLTPQPTALGCDTHPKNKHIGRGVTSELYLSCTSADSKFPLVVRKSQANLTQLVSQSFACTQRCVC